MDFGALLTYGAARFREREFAHGDEKNGFTLSGEGNLDGAPVWCVFKPI